MTLQQLNTKLSANLRTYIRVLDHIDTGDLYKSIKFNCTYDTQLNIKLKSMSYIVYLDEGEFIYDFFKLDSTKKLINQFLTYQLDLDF